MNPIDEGYITVADRLAAFVEKYPDGRIETELVHASYDPAVAVTQTTNKGDLHFTGAGLVIVMARVFKTSDAGRPPDGSGLASMTIPGVTNYTRFSEAENCDTSAIGRALAAIGFLAKNPDGSARISSSDEIAAKRSEDEDQTDPPITQKQRGMLMSMAKKAGMDPNTPEGKVALQAVTLAATGKFNSKQLTNADVDLLVAALKENDEQIFADGPD